jgi:hypothetical protein
MIWCEASGMGCPGTAAAEWVMKPKAANLPMISVSTGAAKPRKDRPLTAPAGVDLDLPKAPNFPSLTNLLRAAPNNATVEAICAATVANAAPLSPILKCLTRR